MTSPTPLLDRLQANRNKRMARPRIVDLYPTPIRKPTWVQRADENRLYGDDGEGKTFFGGDAA